MTRGRKLCSKTNQEEAKRTYRKDQGEEEDGAQGKSGRGTGTVGSAAVSAHDENDRLVRCSPPSSATAAGKKVEYVYVPDLPSESFLQQIQLDDSMAAHA